MYYGLHTYLFTLISSTFHRSASSRVEVPIVMSMQADVENIGVVVETLLCPIAMVDGPVDDENPADNFTVKQLLGCNCN